MDQTLKEIVRQRKAINKCLRSNGLDLFANPQTIYNSFTNLILEQLKQIETLSMLYSFNQMPEWEGQGKGTIWKAPIFEDFTFSVSLRLIQYSDILKNEIFSCKPNHKFSDATIQFLDDCDDDAVKKYFWNTTFPNVFHCFVSDEACEKAECFLLDIFNSGKYQYFIDGSISFISHNYLFRNYFQYSVFHDSQNNIQYHFINSLIKLNPHQNNILIKLLQENKEGFLPAVVLLIKELLNSLGFDYSPRNYQNELDNLSFDEILNKCKMNMPSFCVKLSKVFTIDEVTLLTKTDIQILQVMYHNSKQVINLCDRYTFNFLDSGIYAKINRNAKIIPVRKQLEDKVSLYKWEALQTSWKDRGLNPYQIILEQKPETCYDPNIILTGLSELRNAIEWQKAFKENIYHSILFYPEMKEYYKSLKKCLQGLCNFQALQLYENCGHVSSFRKKLCEIQRENFKYSLKYFSKFSADEMVEKIDFDFFLNQEDKVQLITNCEIICLKRGFSDSLRLTNAFLEIYSHSILLSFISKSRVKHLDQKSPLFSITTKTLDENIFVDTTMFSYICNVFSIFVRNYQTHSGNESPNRVLLFESIPILNKMIFNFIGSEHNKTIFYQRYIENNQMTINECVQYLFNFANSKVPNSNIYSFLNCVQQAYIQLCEYTGENRRLYVKYFHKLKKEFEKFQQYFIEDCNFQNDDILE